MFELTTAGMYGLCVVSHGCGMRLGGLVSLLACAQLVAPPLLHKDGVGLHALQVWMLALLTNLLGCFWWWLAEVQGVSNSW